jgi:uncharacterized protein
MKETIRHHGKQLSVIIERPGDPAKGYALSLHGGGLSTKESTHYLAECFTGRGYGWVSFDCSGWGESTGERAECSLADRLDDALTVIRHYGLRLDILIGTSMGGPVAVKLLQEVSAGKLVLFCPAAYAASAWPLKFGGAFSEVIRRKDSYLDTDIDEACAHFPGSVLYVIGDRDEVIPEAVDRMYRQAFRQARRFRPLLLTDCPHPIHRWAADKPALIGQLRSELSNFIDSNT